MVVESEVASSKAIMGAVFIQYVIYALVYIIDGVRYESLYGGGGASPSANQEGNKKSARQPQNNQEEQKEGGEDEDDVDPNDIQLEQDNQQNVSPDHNQQNRSPTKPSAAVINDSIIEADEEFDFDSSHLFVIVTKNFQKSSIWFFLLAGFCAFRAPIPLTVAMAYLQVVCRVAQLIGTALKKRTVARIGYIAATIFMIIMFFAVMIDQTNYVSFY